MGADVAHAVPAAVVGHVVGVALGVEAELQDLHPGQARIPQELFHLGGGVAQVLGDELQVVEPGGQHAYQRHARTGLPAAPLGGGVAEGHGPVALKAPEVVDADHVEELLRPLDAADPPAEAVGLVGVPVVERVAPELAVLGEGVGRDAGDLLGHAVLVQLEVPGLGPDVGGVQGHVDGHVPDEADAPVVGVIPQRVPLAEEQELAEDPEIQVLGVAGPVGLYRLRPVQADGLVRPLGPAHHAEAGLHRHVEGVVLQPGGVFPPEGGHFLPQRLPPPLKGQPQHLEAVFIDLRVVHPGGVVAPVPVFDLGGTQELLLYQQVQVDEIGVAGEAGEGGIGAVPVAGGAQGQQLPIALAGSLEKVHKTIGALPHGADAVGGGEGAHGHENAAFTIHNLPSFME